MTLLLLHFDFEFYHGNWGACYSIWGIKKRINYGIWLGIYLPERTGNRSIKSFCLTEKPVALFFKEQQLQQQPRTTPFGKLKLLIVESQFGFSFWKKSFSKYLMFAYFHYTIWHLFAFDEQWANEGYSVSINLCSPSVLSLFPVFRVHSKLIK